MNLQGNINLAKLKKVGVATINGVRCVCIPVEENDLYIKRNEEKGAEPFKHISFSVAIWENKDGADEYGNTHYCKRSFSKEYRETHPQEENKQYFGNFKPIAVAGNEAQTTPAPVAENVELKGDDNLPF